MKPNELPDYLTSWDDHLAAKYGAPGTPSRQTYEEGLEAFKLGVLIQEARKQRHLTQEQLAQRAGTTKSYISRIENDASDIRVSTLLRIVRDGLNGQISLSLDLQ